VHHRAEEVRDEGAEVEADVAELDDLQALGHRIADVGKLDQLAFGAVADVPVEEEVADDLREHLRRRLADQVAVELELEAEVDHRLGRDADVDADVAEVAEAELGLARVDAVLDVDAERGAEMRVAVVVGIELQEGEAAGKAGARQRDVDVELELVVVRDIEVEALVHVDAEAEIELPADLGVHGAARLQAQARDADVEVDARAGVEQRAAELQVPLHEDVVQRDARLVYVGVEGDVGDGDRAVVVAVAEHVQLVVQQVEQLLRDVVLVGAGRGLDGVAQSADEVAPEGADRVGCAGELVADQRQRQAGDLAIEAVLQEAEEAVDPVDDQEQVLHRAELAEVEREQIVGHGDEVAARRAHRAMQLEAVLRVQRQRAADLDRAAEDRGAREVHRQAAVDGGAELDVERVAEVVEQAG